MDNGIEILLNVEFDDSSYTKQLLSFDNTLSQLVSLSETRKTNIGGRKSVSKRYIKNFKSELGKELMQIAIDVTYDLIDFSGGTTGNMASAWEVSVSKSSPKFAGYYNGDGRRYARDFVLAHRLNESFAKEGRDYATKKLSRLKKDLLSDMKSNYTIRITNFAQVSKANVGRHTIGRKGSYAEEVFKEGLGIEGSSIEDPAEYAKQVFDREIALAVRRIRYRLNKGK